MIWFQKSGDVVLKTLAPVRWTHWVTFDIWAVTHSSAVERLGYMLLWKSTSYVIVLYSRLNGVHPILYLVNMSHLICVCVCVCLSCFSPMCASRENTLWPSECELNIVCPRLRPCHMNEVCVSAYVAVHPLLLLTHLRLLYRDHRKHLLFLRASDSSKSQMTEKHSRNKSMKTLGKASPKETVTHMHTSPT